SNLTFDPSHEAVGLLDLLRTSRPPLLNIGLISLRHVDLRGRLNGPMKWCKARLRRDEMIEIPSIKSTLPQELDRRKPKVLGANGFVIVGDNAAHRPGMARLLALKGEQSDDLIVQFQDSNLDIIPHRGDDLGELWMKVRASEVGICLLQSGPSVDEVG